MQNYICIVIICDNRLTPHCCCCCCCATFWRILPTQQKNNHHIICSSLSREKKTAALSGARSPRITRARDEKLIYAARCAPPRVYDGFMQIPHTQMKCVCASVSARTHHLAVTASALRSDHQHLRRTIRTQSSSPFEHITGQAATFSLIALYIVYILGIESHRIICAQNRDHWCTNFAHPPNKGLT